MEDKIKVLSIPSRRYPTDQPFLLEVMSKRLGQRGHRVTTIMQSDSPLSKTRQMQWNESQLYVTPARPRSSSLNRLLNLIRKVRSVKQIYKANFLQEPPDIIQIRNDWAVVFWASRICKNKQIPLVFQYSFPAVKTYFERAKPLSPFKGFFSRLTGRITKRILLYIMQRADHVLPISEWMMKDLVEWGLPAEKMTPFPMGFNESALQQDHDGGEIRSKYNIQDHPTAIYFGSMDKLRDLEFLLRTMQLVAHKIPKARLLMVGGKDEEIGSLKEFAGKLGISDHTIFTGQVPYNEMPRFIRAADIGVSPIPPIPIYTISSPTKLAETMGLSRPVVCNDIPEQEKIISESGGGLCVPYTEEAFASAIVKLIESPDLRDEMGQKGQKYIVDNRSYKILTDKLETVYRQVISSGQEY